MRAAPNAGGTTETPRRGKGCRVAAVPSCRRTDPARLTRMSSFLFWSPASRIGRMVRWLVLSGLAVIATGASISVWWVSRYALAVHRLTRGVGDTVFFSADDRPWFRLDEQRHDVRLPE